MLTGWLVKYSAVSCNCRWFYWLSWVNIRHLVGCIVGWLVSWLVGLLVGWLVYQAVVGWLVWCLVGWLVDWLVGWIAGWLVGQSISGWLVGLMVGWSVDQQLVGNWLVIGWLVGKVMILEKVINIGCLNWFHHWQDNFSNLLPKLLYSISILKSNQLVQHRKDLLITEKKD